MSFIMRRRETRPKTKSTTTTTTKMCGWWCRWWWRRRRSISIMEGVSGNVVLLLLKLLLFDDSGAVSVKSAGAIRGGQQLSRFAVNRNDWLSAVWFMVKGNNRGFCDIYDLLVGSLVQHILDCCGAPPIFSTFRVLNISRDYHTKFQEALWRGDLEMLFGKKDTCM